MNRLLDTTLDFIKILPDGLRARRVLEFNPDQPRDESGKWTDGGGATFSRFSKSDAARLIQAVDSGAVSESRNDILDARPGHLYRGYNFTEDEAKDFLEKGRLKKETPGVYGDFTYFSTTPKLATTYLGGGKNIGILVEVNVEGLPFYGQDNPTIFSTSKSIGFDRVTRIAIVKASENSSMWGSHSTLVVVPDKQGFKALTSHAKETPLHAAADAHVAKLSVAVRYAFAMGRKRLKATRDADGAVSALAEALEFVLPATLLKVLKAGGDAGLGMLKKMRVASHKFASTQVNLTGEIATKMLVAGAEIHDDDLAADGREMNPHITVKYGLIDASPDDVRDAVVDFTPFLITLGKVACFEGVEDGAADAVIVEVESSGLLALNKLISESVNAVDAHREYKPHATLAYVKPGLGKRFVGDARFVGHTITVDSFVFSGEDDETFIAQLTGEGLRAAATKIKLDFDVANKNAVVWAKHHAAELIDDISETSRKRIRAAIADLASGEDWNEQLDVILRAVGDDDRADLIARHETMLAASEGQRQGWDQAVEAGLLDEDSKRVWIVVGDEKVCPICEGLDGATAELDGEYEGGYDGPPAHVACRCTEGISA